MPNSAPFNRRIRLGQLILVLGKWILKQTLPDATIVKIRETLVEIMNIPHVHETRQYIERFTIVFYLAYPQYIESDILKQLENYNLRP